MRTWAKENHIAILMLLLFSIILFSDDFFVDAFCITIIFAFAFAYLIYKLFILMPLIISPNFRDKHGRWLDFNFSTSLILAIFTILLIFYSKKMESKKHDILMEKIIFCAHDIKCKFISIEGMTIGKMNGSYSAFEVTLGVITGAVRINDYKNGCARISGYSSYLKINGNKCLDN
jgi:hypothetical protein